MLSQRVVWRILLLNTCILISGMGRLETLWALAMSWDQADVVLTDDPHVTYGPISADADFNGDGRRDLVFVVDSLAMVVLGKTLPARSALSSLVDWTIHFSTHAFLHAPFVLSTGDLNGDGRDDLVFGSRSGWGEFRIDIVIGRPSAGGTIDLTQGNPDVRMNGPLLGTTIATGDFNGDGYKDVLMGGVDAVSIFWGAKVLVDLSHGGVVTNISGMQTFSSPSLMVLAGDLNGDGKSEALISQPRAGADGGGGVRTASLTAFGEAAPLRLLPKRRSLDVTVKTLFLFLLTILTATSKQMWVCGHSIMGPPAQRGRPPSSWVHGFHPAQR